jgi:Response regulators consisting of a CheY-like receiver domain and a winged-helix DNA-binding domain
MSKILVVEDDEVISESVCDMLEREHFTVESVTDGAEAWERLLSLEYDLIILDWNLPSLQGIDILSKFRKAGRTTPVLMFTANSGIPSKIQGLDSGADDYLAKPFDMLELRARVKALLRRPAVYTGEIVQAGNIALHISDFKCYRDAEEIKLHPKEFELLEFLIRNKGRVYSVDEILDRLWSCDSDSSIEAVRKCVTRLRNKIDVPGKPSIVTTVIGRGYKIEE